MALFPTTGGNTVPTQQVPAVGPTAANPNYQALSPYSNSAPNPFAGRDYNQMQADSLESFMDPNSRYIQNARQRGVEYAASRGGLNSSIAAGASERSAIDAASGLSQSALSAQIAQEQSINQDWLDQQGFNRNLASLPYQNSLSMLNNINQQALQDPQLYTPSVVSGMNNFFNQNMNDILKQYFS